jgi:predicted nucleotidyltransferase
MTIKKSIKSHLPHNSLSKKIWIDNKMIPEFREALLKIANAFIVYLGISIDVEDIIMTGSYANYNYTEFSDIDLHIVIDFSTVNSDADLVEEFFNAKKSFWNERHDIELKGIEVELYPQDATEEHDSSGVFSILEGEWLIKPNKFKTKLDIEKIEKNSKKIIKEIEKSIKGAIKASDTSNILLMIKKLKKMRESGLSRGGELSDENVIYKVIRNRGLLQKLFNSKLKIEDNNFSKI